MNTALEGEVEFRAEAAVDRITVANRQHDRHRQRAMTARDALTALAFEVTFIHVASTMMRDGTPLTDADHARLVVAVGRVGVIADEVLR